MNHPFLIETDIRILLMAFGSKALESSIMLATKGNLCIDED